MKNSQISLKNWHSPPTIWLLLATMGLLFFVLFMVLDFFTAIPASVLVLVLLIALVFGTGALLKGIIQHYQTDLAFVDQLNAKRKRQRRQFTRDLTSTIDLDHVLDLIVNTVNNAVDTDNVAILLYDEKKNSFRIVKFIKPLPQNIEIPIKEIIPNYNKGEPLSVDFEVIFDNIVPRFNKIGFNYCFPLEHNKNLLGTLNLIRPGDKPLLENDVEWLTYIVDVSVVSISNCLIFDQAMEKQRIELENIRLRTLDQKKTELINTVAHELRTPLTAIQSYSQILLDDHETLPKEKKERFLGIISGESRRLGTMINQMLDLARITSGRISMNREVYNIVSVLEKAIDTIKVQASEKNLTVSRAWQDDTVELMLDPDKLLQVMLNLLSNAIKYTNSGGDITVGMDVVYDLDLEDRPPHAEGRDSSGLLKVYVQDTGVGMSREDTKRIFDEFYRINNNMTREARGTGLGLSICRSIVEAHGGWIWAESERNVGTTLSFVLPIHTSPIDQTATTTQGAQND